MNWALADVFVRKFNEDGAVLWTTQFGTAADEDSNSIALSTDGTLLVVGETAGSLDGDNAGEHDAFVSKLSPTGTVLWSRQFGTSGAERAQSVASQSDGSAIIAGYTGGALGGDNAGGVDVYIRKINSEGNTLWTRQLGSDDSDTVGSVAIDIEGNVLVGGTTYGDLDGDFDGKYFGLSDAFVLKLSSTGDFLWNKQFGTASFEYGQSLAIDADGTLLIAGNTRGDFHGDNAGNSDAFVMRMAP